MKGWRTILKYSNKDYPDGNRMGDIQIFKDRPLGSVEEKHIWVFFFGSGDWERNCQNSTNRCSIE